MKRFLLSDLHIGHPDAQYDVIEKVIDYVSREYETGDEVVGLGDWLHIDDGIGFRACLAHPMARQLGELAARVPCRLIPGNHDDLLAAYEGRELPLPLGYVNVISPFMSGGLWYCHGHEFDPALIPLNILGRIKLWLTGNKRPTPGAVKNPALTKQYLALVQAVHACALLDACDKEACRGVVFGHTHLPVYQESPHPGAPLLLNDGDMRGSGTFVVAANDEFRFVTWDKWRQDWQIKSL